MGKDIKINYTGFGTGHTKEYYRGKSFRYAGEWTAGVHYASDDYNVDFVSINNCLIACSKSHIATLSNKPSDFEKDGNTIIGLHSELWEFVVSGTRGEEGKEGKPGDLYLPKYDRESHKLIWIRTNSDGCEDIVEDFDFQEYIVALIEEFSTGTDIKENSEIEKLVVTLDGVEYLIDRIKAEAPSHPIIIVSDNTEQSNNSIIININSNPGTIIEYQHIIKDSIFNDTYEVDDTWITTDTSEVVLEQSPILNYKTTCGLIRARAIQYGYISDVIEYQYSINRKLPRSTFYANLGNEYSESREIIINNEFGTIPDIKFYYTLSNGDIDPDVSSDFYTTVPFAVTITDKAKTTLKVIAKALDWDDSDTAEKTYPVKQVHNLDVVIDGNNFSDKRNIILSCATTGRVIYYTIDGTDPRNSESRLTYNNSFFINKTTRIRAIAVVEDWDSWSLEYDNTISVNQPYLHYGYLNTDEITSISQINSLEKGPISLNGPSGKYTIEFNNPELEWCHFWICVPITWPSISISSGKLPVPMTESYNIENYSCYRSVDEHGHEIFEFEIY